MENVFIAYVDLVLRKIYIYLTYFDMYCIVYNSIYDRFFFMLLGIISGKIMTTSRRHHWNHGE